MRTLASLLAALALLTGSAAAGAQTVPAPASAPVTSQPAPSEPAPSEPAPSEPAPNPVKRELAPGPVKRELLAPELPPPSARLSLALTGAAVFVAWYGAGLGASFAWPDAPGAEELRIPVAGPWLALQHTGCPSRGDCNEIVVVLRAIATVFDGVGQLGGMLALGEAAFLPTTRSPNSGKLRKAPSKAELRPMPFVAGQDGLGVGLAGAF